MLAIPSFRKIDDITVYQDDAIWTRFYLVPSTPAIRRDANDRPVFLLTILHTSDDARARDASLPRGSGFMNFDVQFMVDDDHETRARNELQRWVDEEYARRRSDPAYSSLPDYADATAPRVELNDPLLSGGTVKMQTTQSALLVSDRFAESPASLVSGSTAVFNVDLTETGAGMMHDLFIDRAGSGRVDLTPVQVIYDLRMWARLPPVSITVTGDSERIHKTLRKISETNRDNPCTPREVETYRETGTNSSTLTETGAVDVKIDKGDATVPDDVLEALQQYALDLFDTMVEERFLVPAESDDDSLDFDATDPALGSVDPGWGAILYSGVNFGGSKVEVSESVSSLGGLDDKVRSIRVRAGHTVTLYTDRSFSGSSRHLKSSVSDLGRRQAGSARVTRPPTSRYKVRESVNHSTMHLEIKLDRSQVVEWPTGGQATLQTFFAGATREELARHVVEVTADRFNTLGVTVRALVDFETQPIQAVEVQTEYTATDGSGERHTTPGAFTFRAGETAPASFDPTVLEGQREYRFRYRVVYGDGSAGPFTEWETTTSRAVNVAVANPGRLNVEVSGASLNWNVVRSVRVDLVHRTPGEGASLQTSCELTQLTPVRPWQHQFTGALTGTIEAAVTYMLADDKVVDGGTQTIPATNTLFIVPPPQVDVLNVTVVPAGQWADVAQAVVSLEYEAGDGRIYDKTYQLTAIDQLVEWTVLLRDPTRRQFRYRAVVTYKSGGVEERPWVTRTGDQAIVIDVKGSPRLRVNVLSNLVDFTRTPVVTVSLSYGSERKTLSFTEQGAATWDVLAIEGQRDYTYEITWHPPGGDPIASGPKRTADTELFIPRASLPTAGKLDVTVRGFAVDFDATPFVDVALTWKDGDREERATVTLDKTTPNQHWVVEIGDRTERRYHYAVTYNLADGSRVPGAEGDTEDPVVSVRPH